MPGFFITDSLMDQPRATDTDVSFGLSVLTAVFEVLPETESQLCEVLRCLDKKTLYCEDAMIKWATSRWYSSEDHRSPETPPPSIPVVRESEPSSSTSSANSIRPFAFLLGQHVKYTGTEKPMYNGRHIQEGQRCIVKDVGVDKMQLQGADTRGPFWAPFQNWALDDQTASWTHLSDTLKLTHLKCSMCDTVGLVGSTLFQCSANCAFPICISCERHLDMNWSDDVMEVIIQKPTTTSETNIKITYKFYGGNQSGEVFKAKGLDIGKKIEMKKKSNAYKKARSRLEEDRKRPRQRQSGRASRQVYLPPHKRGEQPPGHWNCYPKSATTWGQDWLPYMTSPPPSYMPWTQEEVVVSQHWGGWPQFTAPFQIQPSIEASSLALPHSGFAQWSRPPGLEPAQGEYPWVPGRSHEVPCQIQPSIAGSSSDLRPSGFVLQSSVMAQATDSIVAETSLNRLNHSEQQGETDHLKKRAVVTEKILDGMHCVICLTEKQTEMMLPCSHMCLCASCVKDDCVVPRDVCLCKSGCKRCLCPLCRKPIESVIHVFYGA